MQNLQLTVFMKTMAKLGHILPLADTENSSVALQLIKLEITVTCKLNLRLSSSQVQSTTQASLCQSNYATKGFKRRASHESNRIDLLSARIQMKASYTNERQNEVASR